VRLEGSMVSFHQELALWNMAALEPEKILVGPSLHQLSQSGTTIAPWSNLIMSVSAPAVEGGAGSMRCTVSAVLWNRGG
jgi:hypothetical protein